MRKRALVLLLAYALWGLCGHGLAEEMSGERVTVDVNFAGDWYAFEEFQFALKLPRGWRAVPGEKEVYFMAVDETADRALWIELYRSEGHGMDDVLADLSKLPAFRDVTGMYFNGVPFVRYTAEGLLGYATMTADGKTLLFIKLMPPGDAGLMELATQIMASLTPLSKVTEDTITMAGGDGT